MAHNGAILVRQNSQWSLVLSVLSEPRLTLYLEIYLLLDGILLYIL